MTIGTINEADRVVMGKHDRRDTKGTRLNIQNNICVLTWRSPLQAAVAAVGA